MTNRAFLFVIGGGVLFSFVVIATPRGIAYIAPHSQIAQILAVDIGVLRHWGSSGSLKGEFGEGARGKQVELLQRMLLQDPSLSPSSEVTGYYGELTEQAVKRFQEEQGIDATGYVDAATADALNDIFLEHLCPVSEEADEDDDRLLHRMTKKVPEEYVPPDLIDISPRIKTAGIVCLRKDVAEELERMFEDAEKDGVILMVSSGYRKPVMQSFLYTFWQQLHGEQAKKEIAQPGRSEHQLGSVVDLTDASIGNATVNPAFATSAGGMWLAEHAHNYGFIQSYPEGKEEETGFIYEPWHWRYVGEDIAESIVEEELLFNQTKDSDFKKKKKKND